jgi:hypothetical protein
MPEKENIMTSAKPFGDPKKASILVIGHDPRLQNSLAEAETVFFMNLLQKYPEKPNYGPEKSKYGLAFAVWDYLQTLAGRRIRLEEIYATNLCNEFLDHAKGTGTVFIPPRKAKRGIKEITQALEAGHFKVIVSMAVQPFYYLCRFDFLDEKNETVTRFIEMASPKPDKKEQGLYQTVKPAPFLNVCGNRYHHNGIPLIPVLHVKMWPLKTNAKKYEPLMENANKEISVALVC